MHPIVEYWMNFRGGYIVDFSEPPNAHEHLEARLTLRDFLAQQGVWLDDIESLLELRALLDEEETREEEEDEFI